MSVDLLLRKLEARDALTGEERQALRELVAREERYAPGAAIVREGEPQTESRLLIEGVVARSKMLDDGRRQITELHIPGDFVDLHSFLLKRLEHDIVAVSPVRIAAVPHARLRVVTERFPHLTRMLWLSTLLDAAIHREWIVSAGRRSALEQIAHLFCELIVRYQVVGMAQDGRCRLPMTQNQFADLCGISTVHVNRILQELRQDGLLEWRGGELAVHDFDRLAAAAKFDPSYLGLNFEPR